jgi:hypothetical protein
LPPAGETLAESPRLCRRQLTDQLGTVNAIIARRIIHLAKTGERNPDLLYEGVLKEFRDQRL